MVNPIIGYRYTFKKTIKTIFFCENWCVSFLELKPYMRFLNKLSYLKIMWILFSVFLINSSNVNSWTFPSMLWTILAKYSTHILQVNITILQTKITINKLKLIILFKRKWNCDFVEVWVMVNTKIHGFKNVFQWRPRKTRIIKRANIISNCQILNLVCKTSNSICKMVIYLMNCC